MTEEKRSSLHETSVALCEVYGVLLANGQVTFPLTEEGVNKIDSIVKTVNANYFGVTRFRSRKERAAAYFCLIIKDHPVTDGNKRLATLWLQVYCDIFKLNLKPELTLDVLAVSVEKDKFFELSNLVTIVKFALFGE
jgi:hypothetical protein